MIRETSITLRTRWTTNYAVLTIAEQHLNSKASLLLYASIFNVLDIRISRRFSIEVSAVHRPEQRIRLDIFVASITNAMYGKRGRQPVQFQDSDYVTVRAATDRLCRMAVDMQTDPVSEKGNC